MDKEKVIAYRDKLEDSIEEYMQMPVSQRSAEAVESMCECLEHINALIGTHSDEITDMTEIDYEDWMYGLINTDGSTGPHWSVSDTNSVGRPDDVDELEWNATMNMLYSDFYDVFKQYGVGTTQFYSDVAKAFIHDEDAPDDKIERYYRYIVK